jgi:hypothetical protein
MNAYYKARFSKLWVMLLLTGMSLISFSELSFAVTIGEHYKGGIVFYVDQSGKHGLIAATSDNPGIYTWAEAKVACKNLDTGGYMDWFLPSVSQLGKLYHQKSVVGGFTDGHYWSSTEGRAGDALIQSFSDGVQLPGSKSMHVLFRAVRSF